MISNYRHESTAPTRTQLLAPGGVIDAHWHDDNQIIYAGRGVLTVTTSAGAWVTPGNRAIWIPAGTVHSHRAHGNLELHLVGLPTATNPLDLHAPTALTASPLVRELIIACARNQRPQSPADLRMREVLLDQLHIAHQQPLHIPTPTDPVLAQLCALLYDNPADPRTLSELGNHVGASARTLSRLFRHDLHMTFPQWRTQVRLHHALVLLAEGQSVSTTAHRCGWATPSAFIDTFRQAFGITPGAML